MADFAQELRHYCRNPKCRSKLKVPVANPREAFCARGCHSSYYLKRCLVCEEPFERKSATQKVCRKSKCRSAWRAGFDGGCYLPLSSAGDAQKTPDFIGVKSPLKPDRAWRIVAGELTPAQLHCATVPDGPNGCWEGGEFERLEAKNMAALRKHFAKQAEKCLLQPHHPPVNIVGGYKFPGAPAIDLTKGNF
jgi:hypothetical protein